MRVEVAGNDVYAYSGTRAFDPALPTVVFVHGAANDHSVWALQSRYFAYHGRNVVAVDLPAHGRSGGDSLASVEAIADWIPLLLDALKIERAALVGHSMGALAVLDCAARHGDRASSVVLCGPAAPMTVADVLQDAARRDDHVALELITGWSYSGAAQLGGNRLPGVWLTGNALRLLERTRPGVLATDLAACHAYASAVAAATVVRCPALVIVAARDIMAPPKNAQSLIAALPNARVVTLPECGHAMMAEQPDAVLDALRAFL
jgi:pimeloyl-ACP methyl ester carboxylesterase